jgi:RNA polymerase-binding protein DksA
MPNITSGPSTSRAATVQIPTEEELLAMPESDYMNAAQLGFFRERLEALRQELLDNANSTSESLRETDNVADPSDRATIEEEQRLELRTRDRERKLLQKVDQALARVESGEYGWCEDTGEPIGLERLLARPTASLTLEAQERREARQKLQEG